MSTTYSLDWITDSLAVGQAPMSYDSLDFIRAQGIGAIMNLCAEFCDLHWIEADAGFQVYYFPIPDEEAPDLPELEKALDWLDECLYLGKKTLIHCRFGIGRTGTVVNAYLLRKGLGRKLAGKKLKGLKSQPANFQQWWFLRKYGQQEKPLTIREPSLETKHLVDLFPFFSDYEKLLKNLDNYLEKPELQALCGQGHADCCQDLVMVSFIEAVYLHHRMNLKLGRVERQEAIQRAVAVTRTARDLAGRQAIDYASDGFGAVYRGAGLLCPLNELGECLLFGYRPVACRLFDVPSRERSPLRHDLTQALKTLSDNIFFAFTSRFPQQTPLCFLLSEVVSGRFVQTFFHYLSAEA